MLLKATTKSVLFYSSLFVLVAIIAIVVYVVIKGAINYNRIAACKTVPEGTFCGLQKIDLTIPEPLRRDIVGQVEKGVGKRVVIPKWKSGRTISTADVIALVPQVFHWYKELEGAISAIVGEQVFITSEQLPTTCSILVYEEDGDYINWHYDVNYFEGRFFTLLIPCTIANSCTEYTYYDKHGTKQGLQTEIGKSILFEGDKVFHMATPFCNKGEKRVILSVQFSTNPTINWFNRSLMRLKDIAYIGV